MMHVASSQRSRGDKAEDGCIDGMDCISISYLNFTIFIVLDHKGSLVISFLINSTPRIGGEASIQPSLFYPLAKAAF
jgi:hypothetical protein